MRVDESVLKSCPEIKTMMIKHKHLTSVSHMYLVLQMIEGT